MVLLRGRIIAHKDSFATFTFSGSKIFPRSTLCCSISSCVQNSSSVKLPWFPMAAEAHRTRLIFVRNNWRFLTARLIPWATVGVEIYVSNWLSHSEKSSISVNDVNKSSWEVIRSDKFNIFSSLTYPSSLLKGRKTKGSFGSKPGPAGSNPVTLLILYLFPDLSLTVRATKPASCPPREWPTKWIFS